MWWVLWNVSDTLNSKQNNPRPDKRKKIIVLNVFLPCLGLHDYLPDNRQRITISALLKLRIHATVCLRIKCLIAYSRMNLRCFYSDEIFFVPIAFSWKLCHGVCHPIIFILVSFNFSFCFHYYNFFFFWYERERKREGSTLNRVPCHNSRPTPPHSLSQPRSQASTPCAYRLAWELNPDLLVALALQRSHCAICWHSFAIFSCSVLNDDILYLSMACS